MKINLKDLKLYTLITRHCVYMFNQRNKLFFDQFFFIQKPCVINIVTGKIVFIYITLGSQHLCSDKRQTRFIFHPNANTIIIIRNVTSLLGKKECQYQKKNNKL